LFRKAHKLLIPAGIVNLLPFGPAPCQGFPVGGKYNEANEKLAERKADEIYLFILKNIIVEGSNRKCSLILIGKKVPRFH
jgi:hypothetical protein